MTGSCDLPRYDPSATYLDNFENAPAELPERALPPVPGEWRFCGKPVRSPLGIAAGPLLNGRWIRYYARLGFDILTYKTVRSARRECYPLPNLVPVDAHQMRGDEGAVPSAEDWRGSWAVSFGMPSMEPDFWKKDVAWTKSQLGEGQLLSVSVVGTVQPGWSLDELADDYARCAGWAAEAGADAIEVNFSCPNVCSEDGQLYQQPEGAAAVATRVREALGSRMPLLVKVGFLPDEVLAERFLTAVSDLVDGIVTTNSVPAKVRNAAGEYLFEGQSRGICGKGTLSVSADQVRRFRAIIDRHRLPLTVHGVGGIETADDVRRYLEAGAESVQLATAVMRDPLVGVRIRESLSR